MSTSINDKNVSKDTGKIFLTLAEAIQQPWHAQDVRSLKRRNANGLSEDVDAVKRAKDLPDLADQVELVTVQVPSGTKFGTPIRTRPSPVALAQAARAARAAEAEAAAAREAELDELVTKRGGVDDLDEPVAATARGADAEADDDDADEEAGDDDAAVEVDEI